VTGKPGNGTVNAMRNPNSRRTGMVALLLAALLTAGCLETDNTVTSRPEGGPFDPGQSELPDETRVVLICGGDVVDGLRKVTERYFDVAREWERYKTYAEGVLVDGVTPEEYDGGKQRSKNLEKYLANYRDAAERLRKTGGAVTGDFVADCDREVLVRFETLYQERETEITYVAKENERTTNRLRNQAGVAEEAED
jgi:hypothetical protein